MTTPQRRHSSSTQLSVTKCVIINRASSSLSYKLLSFLRKRVSRARCRVRFWTLESCECESKLGQRSIRAKGGEKDLPSTGREIRTHDGSLARFRILSR